MENQNNLNETQIRKQAEYAERLMLHGEKSAEDTIKLLVDQGTDPEVAATIVKTVEQRISTREKPSTNKDMIVGGLLFAIGLIITVGSYAAAAGGGTYVVAWGAMLFGAIQFIRGYANSKGV